MGNIWKELTNRGIGRPIDITYCNIEKAVIGIDPNLRWASDWLTNINQNA